MAIPKTVAELKPAPYNPRRIDDQAGTALKFSMSEFGDLSCFVFNVRTGHLVSGHQRRDRLDPTSRIVNFQEVTDESGTVGLAHIAEGKKLWPIRFVDWDEIKEKAANLTANNPHISGDFTEGVGALMQEVQSGLPDIFDQSLLFKITDDIEAFINGNGADISDEPEHDLSPMPYESYDYVVLIFRNQMDWTAAVEHFGLKQVIDPANKKAIGVGHVVDGVTYLCGRDDG